MLLAEFFMWLYLFYLLWGFWGGGVYYCTIDSKLNLSNFIKEWKPSKEQEKKKSSWKTGQQEEADKQL